MNDKTSTTDETDSVISRSLRELLKIPNSDYSVCVVVGDGAKDAKFPAQTRREGVFVYHRRDIYNDNLPSCRNFQRKATIAHSIVQFNDNAFKDIGTFLYEKENANIVDRYTKYFNGETTSETRFRDEVAKSVVVSFKAEEIWKSKSDLSLYTIWRYFGTKDGYIRVFPGVQLPDYFTHETRSWWRRSKSQRGILTMTTPYVDAWGAGLMVTFSRAIYVGRQNGAHTDLDDVEGVLGYDVSLSYLHRVVYADNPECQRADNICMLVDNSGFIIIHPDFVDPNIRESERRALVEDIHLVQKESDIAAHLIARSVMSRQSCANFDNHKLQMTYRVQLNDGENHISGPNYDMWEVEGTSVYLVRKTVTDVPVQCCTNIPMISPASKTCSDSVFCDCLCHISIAFDTCLNINNKDGISQTCIAKTPDTEYTTDPDVTTGLQDCYNPACETETTEGDCYSYTGCSWCVRDDNAPLSKPCCRGVDTCDFGKVLGGSQNVCPDTTQRPVTSTQETTAPKNSSQVDTAVIVGAVLGSVVVILCIVIILICYRRHVCHPRSNPADDYLTAVPTVRDNTAGVVNQQYAGMQTGSPPPYNSYSDTKDTNFIPMHHNATTTNNYHTMPGSSNSSGSSGSVPSHSQASQQQHLPPNTLPTDKRL
ncbi:VWFA and cache domain-containing protein 1-like [Argopecten irradians]|uniref:VWFA and cache domain-containing protein 1-like n=1 Tax=Argopecten irradians TaxID=31199 RepID=UPI00371888A7